MALLELVEADPTRVYEMLPSVLAGERALYPLPAELMAGERDFLRWLLHTETVDIADLGRLGNGFQNSAVIIRTSGSTGNPKRVALSADSLRASATSTNKLLGDGCWLLAMPANYIAGLQVLIRSYLAGTTPEIAPHLAQSSGSFAVEQFVQSTRKLQKRAGARPLLTALVPTQLYKLLQPVIALEQNGHGSSSSPKALCPSTAPASSHNSNKALDQTISALQAYKHILIGGQKINQNLLQTAAKYNINLTTTYGGSETAGGCLYQPHPPAKPNLQDTKTPHATQMRVADTTLTVKDKIVYVAGSTLALGYLGDPERTRKSFVQQDGKRWWRTGDIGTITEGELAVTGREDNIITTGGLKLDLNEVHGVLAELPGLESAVAVPFEDDKWGTRFAVYADGSNRDIKRYNRDELNQILRAKLGRHAGCAAVTYFDWGLPLLSNGKVDVSELASDAAKLAGSALAAQAPSPRDAV